MHALASVFMLDGSVFFLARSWMEVCVCGLARMAVMMAVMMPV